MNCPCCGAAMRHYETITRRRTGELVAYLWVCDTCENEPTDECQCADRGCYYTEPPSDELHAGGGHFFQ